MEESSYQVSRTKLIVAMRDDVGIAPFNAAEKLADIKLIGAAIVECMIENNPEGVMEVVESHLEAVNKSKFLKKAGVPRSTMYKVLKMKNPTIKTLSKIMYAAHHAKNVARR